MEFKGSMNSRDITIEKSSSKDIAIVGMAARFPLADSVEQFWNNLKNGVDCVRKMPESRRKDLKEYLSFKNIDKESITYGDAAFLQRIDTFDYEFFDFSPREASLMDPNQRLFLETAWAAIEDAGYPVNKIKGSNVGVYVGFIGESEYKNLIEDAQPSFLSVSTTGNCTPIVASRISYLLDLRGPNMIINTSCSSSLVAVHLACKSILTGECEAAVAGGVQTHALPIRKAVIGIESSDGKSKSFDDNSDGTGVGEGAGAIFLKPLNKALKDKDNIYAIIKGSAVNQDGSSIGISAPNPIAQEDVIVKAWRDAGINPETISYIEAHGTGTKLGDPVEINGVTRAFARYTNKKQFCAIGAVKTNIGHLDSAAGIAGLIKAVLALKNKEIPPSIHFEKPNRNIDFCHSPTYFNDRLIPWDVEQGPRRCGVSSFGISGTNCHMILEEAPENKDMQGEEQDIKIDYNVLTISAKNRKALKRLVKDYISFLKTQEESSLGNICYTSNIVKGQYSCRLAVVAQNIRDMLSKLEDINSKGIDSCDIGGIYYGSINTDEGSEEKFVNCSLKEQALKSVDSQKSDNEKKSTTIQETLDNMLELYCKGGDAEWEALYHGKSMKKVSLPQYPFERNRCWVEIPKHKRKEKNACNKLNPIDIDSKEKNILEYSEIEKELSRIFCGVLGYSEIDNQDNFFAMGGDSIYALAVVNSVNKAFNVDVKIKEFMEKPTIRELAQKVKLMLEEKSTDKGLLRKIEKADVKKYYPVSPAQKRMFVLKDLNDQHTSYNISSAMLIKGDLDVKRLEKALAALIQRHEALRTSFEIIDGEIVQKINPEVNFSMRYEEYEETDIDTIVKKLIGPFKLNKAPLFRVSLVRISPKSYLLVTDMHHIISDGASTNILIRDLINLYENKQLKKDPLQYKDFSEWQNRLMETEYFKGQEAYWLDKFAGGIPVADIPLDFPRTKNLAFKGNTLYFEISKELNESLLKLSVETETTMFMVLFAAYNVLLYRYTGKSDIVVGVAVSGRTHADLDNTVGMFVNSLPLVSHLNGEMAFRDFLDSIKKNTLEAYANQDYPFDMLVEKLGVGGDRSRNPLFDTMFVMQNTKKTEVKLESLEFFPYKLKEEVCKFDIMVNCFEDEGTTNFGINYCVELFKQETIERLWRDYIAILENVSKNPFTRVKDVCLDRDLLIPKFDSVDIEFRLP